MTEYAVFRESIFEGALERVDVVDAFADERAFAEHVLVNIGDSARVRIDTRLAAEQPRIPRLVDCRHAHRDARLQDAVTLGDALLAFIKDGTIEWVRHGAHKISGSVAR